MKKGVILGLAAVSLFTVGNLHAEDIKTWGHATIWTSLHSDVDKTNRFKTNADAEVDFEKTMGKTSVRLDLDINHKSVAAKGISLSTTTDIITIEQAKIVRGLSGYNASLTVGAFNSPIGFIGDTQDHTDRLQFTNSQLFSLRPANLAGGMWSWWGGPAAVDLFYANDWRGQANPTTTYQGSFGGKATFSGAKANLAVGYITSKRTPTSPVPTDAGNIFDAVVTTRVIPHTLLALEYLENETNMGWGITGHHEHGQHSLTARFDSVDPDGNSNKSTQTTVAIGCAVWESVETILEWNSTNPASGATVDKVTLAWVAKF
jgi:hypothetical protein